MVDLTTGIAQADASKMETLLRALRLRYAELFPGWEIIMVSIEKGADRNAQLDRMITMLQNMKT